jgi:hypothetical protein
MSSRPFTKKRRAAERDSWVGAGEEVCLFRGWSEARFDFGGVDITKQIGGMVRQGKKNLGLV